MPTGKARHYRAFDPSLYHEVTQRVHNGTHLLDPNCLMLKVAIYGQLARSLSKYKITLLALHFMTDHFHAMYGTSCPYRFAKFLAHFHSGITLAYNRLRAAANPGVKVEPVSLWHEMGWFPVATDENSVRWRLGYIMGQAVKAGLVDHPIQFPGASTIDAMIDGIPMIGKTHDATRKSRDARRKNGPEPDEAYEEELTLEVTPPSCWAHLSHEELRQRYIEVADKVANVPLAELRRRNQGKKEVPVEPTPKRHENSDAPPNFDDGADAANPPDLGPGDPVGDPANAGVGELEAPGPCQATASTSDFPPPPGENEKVHIPPRLDEFGNPYAAGPVKPKPSYYTADGKRKKRPLILACSQSVRDAYEAAYNEWVEDYLAAKEIYRAGMVITAAGLHAPILAIPPNMMLGSMPYPKT